MASSERSKWKLLYLMALLFNDLLLFTIRLPSCVFAQPTALSIEPTRNLPTNAPTELPTNHVTNFQSTLLPTAWPVAQPTVFPSEQPSARSSPALPTRKPTSQPTLSPTTRHSTFPTTLPTTTPSLQLRPTGSPTYIPSAHPTAKPTSTMTYRPSSSPTVLPTAGPTGRPSTIPTVQPTTEPTARSTARPNSKPTISPISMPTGRPSVKPSVTSTTRRTSRPSDRSSTNPTSRPMPSPVAKLTTRPTFSQTKNPTTSSTSWAPLKLTSKPTSPLIAVLMSVEIDMGLVYDVMDTSNQQRFESLLNTWLVSMVTNTKVYVTQIKVISQHLIGDINRRRLTVTALQQNIRIILTLTGLQPSDTLNATPNIQFKDHIITILENSSQVAVLVAMIQDKAKTDPLYFYFRDITRVSLSTRSPTSNVPSKPSSVQSIIGGVIGAVGGILVFGIAFAIVVRRWRRKSHSKDSNTDDIIPITLPIDRNHFSDSSNPTLIADRNFVDETSSIGTFRTLDNLHSSDTAFYFSNVDPDILDTKRTGVTITVPHRSGFIDDLFDTSDGEYSLSLGSLKTSELDTGSLMNRSETSSDHISTSSVSRIQRECIAPPGKLSIVIDSSRYGPIIYEIKDRSPMENILFVGDRIIKVDGIDTSRMTAVDVTRIMAQKADARRNITVLSTVNNAS